MPPCPPIDMFGGYYVCVMICNVPMLLSMCYTYFTLKCLLALLVHNSHSRVRNSHGFLLRKSRGYTAVPPSPLQVIFLLVDFFAASKVSVARDPWAERFSPEEQLFLSGRS